MKTAAAAVHCAQQRRLFVLVLFTFKIKKQRGCSEVTLAAAALLALVRCNPEVNTSTLQRRVGHNLYVAA